jgi:glycosyltransferase involved in cell wall biosynthesis
MIDSFKSGKIHVLPNTVNLAMFDGVAEKTPKEPPVLLSVGRLMAEKNHLDLVHAFARLAPIFPEWTLRLVGEGELRPMLEAEVAKLGLVPRIALPGVSRDVASEYANASIVVLPSIYESFGLVAAEALASGRPVVAFECCTGVAEMVVNNVNGQLVSVQGDRVSNLCSSLEELMGNADQRRRLGAAGPGSVRRFAINSALDAWESFLLSFQIQ